MRPLLLLSLLSAAACAETTVYLAGSNVTLRAKNRVNDFYSQEWRIETPTTTKIASCNPGKEPKYFNTTYNGRARLDPRDTSLTLFLVSPKDSGTYSLLQEDTTGKETTETFVISVRR